ncbi:hypothetical protein CAPTEDRAFT_190896 [Capitella teleta]|uniref:Integrase zinc-binding domain-containing protein n=1 Tax=Capitella teleta TaxID=283909 RepID=R7U3A1_CAPTE|nr:hypothetical protein CAPTEDRAFT_190896 [Capitella teleta]|eukprot:ELU00424.1 hypothetical protein CAPTEDRAFT_190896 [Capitella teleta]
MNWKKDQGKILDLSLCELHFEANQFMNPAEKGVPKPRKQLRKDALPSLFTFKGESVEPSFRRVLERRALFALLWFASCKNAFYPVESVSERETSECGGLCVLSPSFYSFIEKCESIFMHSFEHVMHMPRVQKRLVTSILKSVDTTWTALKKSGRRLLKIKSYRDFSSSLSQDCLDINVMSRIVIPDDLQQEILNSLHDGHQGVEKTIELTCVWWPNLTNQVKFKVEQCKLYR